jgi:hypothetical protein
MSGENCVFQNRAVLKGLDDMYRENKKSGDGACVEFFDQLMAADHLACVSEKFPTSMLFVLTPSTLMGS